MSHPVWVRGLKPQRTHQGYRKAASHPVWVRGLKPLLSVTSSLAMSVAPRVGAWIETINLLFIVSVLHVAPRVGAWIETIVPHAYYGTGTSHPVWVRGLKLPCNKRGAIYQLVAPRVGAWIETQTVVDIFSVLRVAPRVGAWIETRDPAKSYSRIRCRTPCGCVD